MGLEDLIPDVYFTMATIGGFYGVATSIAFGSIKALAERKGNELSDRIYSIMLYTNTHKIITSSMVGIGVSLETETDIVPKVLLSITYALAFAKSYELLNKLVYKITKSVI